MYIGSWIALCDTNYIVGVYNDPVSVTFRGCRVQDALLGVVEVWQTGGGLDPDIGFKHRQFDRAELHVVCFCAGCVEGVF